jgi:hypothetical protein
MQVAGQPLSLEDYDTVIYRVRGDGRRYIASLRTENWIVDDKSQDVWQAFIFARHVVFCFKQCQLLRLTNPQRFFWVRNFSSPILMA